MSFGEVGRAVGSWNAAAVEARGTGELRKPGVVVVAALLMAVVAGVSAGRLGAMPMSEDECKALYEEQTALERQGVRDQVSRGPAAASDLGGEQLEAIARYLRLEESLRFRCGKAVNASIADEPDEGGKAVPAGEAADPEEGGDNKAGAKNSAGDKKSEAGALAPAAGESAVAVSGSKRDFSGFEDKDRPQPAAAEPAEAPADTSAEWRQELFGNY